MTKGKWQPYRDGKPASACHLRWQPKIEVFHGVEGRLPSLPSLFLKKEKNEKYSTLKEFFESGGNGGKRSHPYPCQYLDGSHPI